MHFVRMSPQENFLGKRGIFEELLEMNDILDRAPKEIFIIVDRKVRIVQYRFWQVTTDHP